MLETKVRPTSPYLLARRFLSSTIKSIFSPVFLCAIVIGFVSLSSSCKKKDRLTASTFNFGITPPAATVAQGETLTLTAHGSSSGGTVSVNPTWTVSSSAGTLSTFLGPQVVFTPQALGDATVTATYDGVMATSQLVVVTHNSGSTIFDVYDDDLPIGTGIDSDIFTSAGLSIQEMTTGYNPQGYNYQRTTNAASGSFWGVTLDAGAQGFTTNLQTYSAGTLKFALRLVNRTMGGGEILRVECTATGPAIGVNLVNGSNGFNRLSTDWQEISIPISSFSGLGLTQVKVPFAIVGSVLSSNLTFDVDAVRWQQ